MPRIFDLKTRTESVHTGSNNPCGTCKRQFANYTCPSCNLQYCSLPCYRSESHSACTESFYKTALAEQIQSEPTKSDDEKRQMLELLKRFEEESLEDNGESSDEDISARIQGIDLNKAGAATLWGLLSEDEKERFTKAVTNPSSEGFKQLLGARELLEGRQEPWWVSEGLSQDIPTTKDVPRSMRTGKFNPLLLLNVLHLSLTYAYTLRTFALATLTSPQEPIQPTEELEMTRDFILPLSPFLREKKSTTMFTSVDGVITDWASHLSELPKPELLGLLTRDAKRLFRAQPVVLATDEHGHHNSHHDYCVRFLSDIHNLFGGLKKYTHITHKLVFYLAFITNLPVDASKDLILAIETWQKKNRNGLGGGREVHDAQPRVVVEEL